MKRAHSTYLTSPIGGVKGKYLRWSSSMLWAVHPRTQTSSSYNDADGCRYRPLTGPPAALVAQRFKALENSECTHQHLLTYLK